MKRWLPMAILLTSALYICEFRPEHQAFKLLFKLIPMWLILYYAYSHMPLAKNRIHWLMLTGLFFGMLGDGLIMYEFVIGLAAFLIGHLFYTTAFLVQWRFSWLRFSSIIPIAIYSIMMGRELVISLMAQNNAGLVVPVLFYIIVISLMGWSAIMTGNRWAVIGSFLFLISDSILSWNLFVSPVFFADILIMTSYYSAQFIIARSAALPEKREVKVHP
ncbi:lysoplasmalogenase [Paenibacillus qinlingensis]|uniref:lysoplasmalogenase n=1 Tax=Paenibacillus qinlingensis TaxID=1837343 RepID=UPI001565F167|nr:lysoplasmalogenase [Paenibacillus qinlingensis]NQX63071.1 lysoplasmalogenase [Paenibacillus qinlingensis]